jgi:hypothetical protein
LNTIERERRLLLTWTKEGRNLEWREGRKERNRLLQLTIDVRKENKATTFSATLFPPLHQPHSHSFKHLSPATLPPIATENNEEGIYQVEQTFYPSSLPPLLLHLVFHCVSSGSTIEVDELDKYNRTKEGEEEGGQKEGRRREREKEEKSDLTTSTKEAHGEEDSEKEEEGKERERERKRRGRKSGRFDVKRHCSYNPSPALYTSSPLQHLCLQALHFQWTPLTPLVLSIRCFRPITLIQLC